MALITLSNALLAFGHVALLDHTAMSLEAGERLGLIGRNGTGKSSLLKILAGLEKPDDGVVQVQQNLRRYYVAQEPDFPPGLNVFEAVSDGLAEVKALRERYESQGEHSSPEELDEIQTRIEALNGWTWEQRVSETLERLRLDPAALVDSLSGGTRKRVALARALVAAPDVLLLDEPTNHLDLDAIFWLQELINDFPGAVVVITHDRAFLDAVSSRILELDRGILRSYPGRFSAYEDTKARELESEALANARADKMLAQEEVWIRRGVEARRTRSVSRIQRLTVLREQRSQRRDVVGKVRLDLDTGRSSGKIVAELTDVSLHFGGGADGTPRKDLVDNLSVTILRGDKVALIGPNGAGKTSLLRVILGSQPPSSGTVRLGSKLEVAYFDQMREVLDPEATLADTISPGSEWIEIGNTRKHVMGYLGDFLFAPARANSPVKSLSGGERNRLLLARLFARPANVLVLDEPTNDLDIETLELLEELLQRYDGTVFLVSHDRRFLDAVVTSTLVFEGNAQWREYEGGVEDWLTQSRRAASFGRAGGNAPPADSASAARAAEASAAAAAAAAKTTAPMAPTAPTVRARKLSYKEQRELDGLPARLEALETEQRTLAEVLAGTAIYTETPAKVAEVQARYEAIDTELMTLLERWETLSAPAV